MRVLYCLFFCLVNKGCSHWGADIHSYNLRNRSIQPMDSDTWRNGVNRICSLSHDLRARSNSTDAMLPQLPAQRRRRRRKLGRKCRKTKSLLKRMIQPTQQGEAGAPTLGARRGPNRTTRRDEMEGQRRPALPSRTQHSMTFPAPFQG